VCVHRDTTVGALDVSFTTVDGTALATKNYTANVSVLHFNEGQNDLPIIISLLDNTIYDISRSFNVRITAAPDYIIPADATVTITENDPAPTVILLPVTSADLPYTTNVVEGNDVSVQAILVSNGVGQFTPMGIAGSDYAHCLYLADYYNHRIQLFTASGEPHGNFGSYGSDTGQFKYPHSVAVDSAGNVYVTDANNRVSVFDGNGNYLRSFGSGYLLNPRGIAVNSALGKVYVVDSGDNRVVVFSTTGTYLTNIDRYTYPVTGETLYFNNPTGIDINSAGNVYVTDTGNNRVSVFNSDLVYNTQFSSDVLALKAPQGIAIGANGNIYVVDHDNYRVVVYDSANMVIRSSVFGSYGSNAGKFSNPRMLTVYSGNVYVTDSTLNWVTYFSTTGSYQGYWGGPFSALPVSVHATTTDGTAFAGDNYTAVDQAITFAPGQYVYTTSIHTISRSGYKPTKFCYVNLTSPVNAVVGTLYPYSVIQILNNQPAPVIKFSPAIYSADKNADYVTLTLIKTGLTELPATVYYSTVDSTAAAGQNFTGVAVGSVTFLPGETSKTFTISLLHTPGFCPNATFNVSLTSASYAVLATTGTSAQVTLYSTPTDIPMLQFSADTYVVKETDGHVRLTVNKIGATAFTASIHWRTSDASAQAGKNYTTASGTLTFAPGETSKIIDIDILDTPGYNPDAVFLVVLESPVNAAWGMPSVGIVKIENVDFPAAMQFNVSNYLVDENAGMVTLNATKSGVTTMIASVNYTTRNGNATAGQNFTGTSGMLVFYAIISFLPLYGKENHIDTGTTGLDTRPAGRRLRPRPVLLRQGGR
jgi:DNA-binding beta-propeller fold protein YncE